MSASKSLYKSRAVDIIDFECLVYFGPKKITIIQKEKNYKRYMYLYYSTF